MRTLTKRRHQINWNGDHLILLLVKSLRQILFLFSLVLGYLKRLSQNAFLTCFGVVVILINQETLSVFMLLVVRQIRETCVLLDSRFGDRISIVVGDFLLMAFEERGIMNHLVFFSRINIHLGELVPLKIDRPIYFVRVLMFFGS